MRPARGIVAPPGGRATAAGLTSAARGKPFDVMKPKKGNPRTASRALALQGLFMLDVQGEAGLPAAREYVREQAPEDEIREYALQCLEGTFRLSSAFDAHIGRVAEHWDLARIAVTDRNILRLAMFEMTQVPDLPPKVAISEAIELAKRFSTAESARFVNGILDRLLNSNVKWDLAVGKGEAGTMKQER